MTSLTRGPKSHSRRPISTEQVRALMSLRRRGMTCEQVAKELGIGESTVARYSSAWWKNEGSKKFERQRKKGNSASRERTAKVSKKKVAAPDANPKLSPEQIAYINAIHKKYEGQHKGAFIGNLFIRIGKFFGGHYPV